MKKHALFVAITLASSLALAGHDHDDDHHHDEHKHEHHDHDHKHEHEHHEHGHDHDDHKHEHDHHGHDHDDVSLEAHEHGKAKLQLLWEKNTLKLDLDTPAMNIFGFEGEPSNAKQRKQMAEAKHELESFDHVFELEGVACDVRKHTLEEESHGHHSDLNISTTLNCGAPKGKSVTLHVELFEHFPATHEVAVEWIVGDKAGQATLTPDEHHLVLPAAK